jgi:hypothetical protein
MRRVRQQKSGNILNREWTLGITKEMSGQQKSTKKQRQQWKTVPNPIPCSLAPQEGEEEGEGEELVPLTEGYCGNSTVPMAGIVLGLQTCLLAMCVDWQLGLRTLNSDLWIIWFLQLPYLPPTPPATAGQCLKALRPNSGNYTLACICCQVGLRTISPDLLNCLTSSISHPHRAVIFWVGSINDVTIK